MARNANKKMIRIITYIILAAVLLGVIGFFAYLTNGFKSDPSNFYVEVNEKVYKTDNIKELTLPSGTDIKFNCSYLLGKVDNTFSVKVLPNVGKITDFDFYANDMVYSFCAESEYTKGFNISKQNDGFTVNIPSNYSILTILQKNYEGQTIALDESVDTFSNSYFVISVTSSDGKATVSIPIKFTAKIGVTGVELDKGDLLL